MINELFFNDAGNLYVYIIYIVLAFILLGLSVFFHELGHKLYFRYYLKKNINIKFIFKNIWSFRWEAGANKDYENLTDEEYKQVNLFGILFGAAPIIFTGLFYFPLYLLLFPYLIGCREDFEKVITIWNKEERAADNKK